MIETLTLITAFAGGYMWSAATHTRFMSDTYAALREHGRKQGDGTLDWGTVLQLLIERDKTSYKLLHKAFWWTHR